VSSRAVTGVGSIHGGAVAPERTSVPMPEVEAALARAYTRATGSPPSPPMLKSLAAQASLETGSGQAMYNFNFGGVKGASPEGLTANCLTHEVVGEKDVVVRQAFRAYSSLDAGADDYVRTMVSRFSGSMQAAGSGNLDAFAHALKQAGYYTASETDYAAGLKSAAKNLGMGDAPDVLPVPTLSSLPQTADLSRLFDALSRTALRIGDPTE